MNRTTMHVIVESKSHGLSLSFKCYKKIKKKTHAFGFSLYIDIEHFSCQQLAQKNFSWLK